MANPGANVDQKGRELERTGYSYNPTLSGASVTFWKWVVGTAEVTGSQPNVKIRLNVDTIASYTSYKYGFFQFRVNVPTTPSTGEAKKWGLLMPDAPTVGSAYFEITGATFRAVSYDDGGTVQTTTLTWSGEAAETLFEIEWEKDYVIFKLAGTVVATHKTRVGTTPLPLYLHNGDADNTDIGVITIGETSMTI